MRELFETRVLDITEWKRNESSPTLRKAAKLCLDNFEDNYEWCLDNVYDQWIHFKRYAELGAMLEENLEIKEFFDLQRSLELLHHELQSFIKQFDE